MSWRNFFVEKREILSHRKLFRQSNSLATYLVKSLLSRNFCHCQKCVRENSRNILHKFREINYLFYFLKFFWRKKICSEVIFPVFHTVVYYLFQWNAFLVSYISCKKKKKNRWTNWIHFFVILKRALEPSLGRVDGMKCRQT